MLGNDVTVLSFADEVEKIKAKKADKDLEHISDEGLRDAMRNVLVCDDVNKGREAARALLVVATTLDGHAERLNMPKLAEIALQIRLVAGYQLGRVALAAAEPCLEELASMAADLPEDSRTRLQAAQEALREAMACDLPVHPLLADKVKK
jgi:hypothetical protein